MTSQHDTAKRWQFGLRAGGTRMDDATQPQRTNRRKTASLTFVLVVACLVSSTLLTVRSYRRSDSLTLADVTIRTEEGLIWLLVPLVRLARTEEATTEWTTYKRRRGFPVWETENTEMITLRLSVKNSQNTSDLDAGFMWGFGYQTGSWLSDSRPGPYIKSLCTDLGSRCRVDGRRWCIHQTTH